MKAGGDADQSLLKALAHPLRRSLLRLYVESPELLSPKGLSELTEAPLPNISYHVRVLLETGAIELADERPARGSMEHFYKPASLVKKTPWALAMLDLPPGRRRSKKKRPKPKKKRDDN